MTITIATTGLGCAKKEVPASTGAPITNRSSDRDVPNNPSAPSDPAGAPAPRTHVQSLSANGAVDDIVATVGNTNITRRQLEAPLVEAYGLNMLAKIAQLEVAKNEAKSIGITVTSDDVKNETERYLATLFNEDRDRDLKVLNDELDKAERAKDNVRVEQIKSDIRRERNMVLDQLLQQQKVTRVDFNLVMETNTYLRAIAQSALNKQGPISDEALQQAFNHLYGEKVVVRDVQVADLKEATEVKRRLASGEPFESVAREMSRHQPSAALGGELQPFSRDTPDFPKLFKDVAFTLKPGEVSDATLIGDSYHIIKLEQKIPPQIVKFEDVKGGVREFLVSRQLELGVQELRSRLQRDVVTLMKINDPMLRQQYDDQRNRAGAAMQEKSEMKRELDRRIQQDRANKPASEPAPAPVPAAPTTQPASPTTR